MQFKPKNNSQLIFGQIRKIRKITDGVVSVPSFETDWIEVLKGAIKIDTNGDRDAIGAAIHATVFSPLLRLDFTDEDFDAVFGSMLSIEMQRPVNNYFFYFCFTGPKDYLCKRIITKEVFSDFQPNLASRRTQKILSERQTLRDKELASRESNTLQIPETDHGQFAIVKSMGINPIAAYQKASDIVDTERGLANFVANEFIIRRRTHSDIPVNGILEKPFTTAHFANGKLATPTFWYQASWPRRSKVKNHERTDTKVVHRLTLYRKAISNNPMKPVVSELLRQYCRAFDTSDYRDAFLRAWTLLENLTDASGNYELLVRRASRVWVEEDQFKQLGQFLREQRNEFVHSSSSNDNVSENLLYLTKELIEPLMHLYIFNTPGLETKREVASFLDLPASKVELSTKIKLLEKAVKFRNPP